MESGETNGAPVVELIEASKVYRADGNLIYAVRDADLALTKGSFTAIVGRSGCGKSTLLNLAGAVDLPTSGEVRIERLSTRELNDNELSRLRRTRIGFVFQFFNLLPTLSVAENVELPLLLDLKGAFSGQSRTERVAPSGRWWRTPPPAVRGQAAGLRKRATELLEMVGLAGKAGHLPHQLSGGEMQRAAIARALVHEPRVVIADEPTGNLDSANADIVLRLLQRITREMGHTVLMATHSREAAEFASRVLSMRDGRLLLS